MKIIRISFLYFLFLSACWQQPSNFFSDFKIHTISKFLINKDENITYQINFKELNFSQKVILEIKYHPDGRKIVSKFQYFDQTYQKEVIEYFDSNNNLDSQNSKIYFLQRDGKVGREIILNHFGDTNKIIHYFYDSSGNLSTKKEIVPLTKAEIQTDFHYEFLPNGNLHRIIISNSIEPKAIIVEEFDYSYNSQTIKKIITNKGDSTNIVILYRYNSFGLINEEVLYSNNVMTSKYKYSYTFY